MGASRRSTAGEPIEIIQHFSAEGSAALDRVVDAFERTHGDDAIDNRAVHISMLRLHVKSHILKGDQPDVWDEWPGKNIRPAVDAGVVADVTSVWTDSEMEEQYVDIAKEMARFDGTYRCIPLNLFRINNLFYNVDLLESAGIDPSRLSGPEAFLDALATLDETLDVPGLVVFAKDPFGIMQFWETLLIAHGGPTAYAATLDGEVDAHEGAIRAATKSLDAALEYAPDDVQFLSSVDADDRFAAGEAAFAHNGDWSIQRFGDTANFEYERDWDCISFPGTEDAFQMNMDALVPSAHSDRPQAVERFLEFAGSKRGLELFNAESESIPPRTDVPLDSLHPLTREHHAELNATAHCLESITHGLGAEADQVISIKSTIAEFLDTRDVDAAVQSIVRTLRSE